MTLKWGFLFNMDILKTNPKSVNFNFWFGKAGWICGPPNTHGVYAIAVKPKNEYFEIIGKERILYIGSSQNIAKRFSSLSSPYRIIFDRFSDSCLVYMYCHICINYQEIEKILIKKFKPLLNKNNKK